MPASTKTYDCLFEFTNDMAQPTILHLTRCSTGGVELWEGESVTLILESGSTYYYWDGQKPLTAVYASERHSPFPLRYFISLSRSRIYA